MRSSASPTRASRTVAAQESGVAVHVGHARFVGPKEVEVGEQRLSAEQIFINVGGRADVPRIPGLEKVPYYTNSSIMAVDFLPEHLVILGGSYIGLEFGQMYRRFGSEVTIIQRSDAVSRARTRTYRRRSVRSWRARASGS